MSAAIEDFDVTSPAELCGTGAVSTGMVGRGSSLRGALLTVSSQSVSSATTFLRMVLLARFCSSAEVGLYAMSFTAILFMFAIHERLVESGYLVSAHRREPRDQRTLLGSSIVISLGVALAGALVVAIGGLGAVLLGRATWIDAGQAMGTALLATALAMPPIIFREFSRAASFAQFALVDAMVIDAVTFVMQVLLLAVLWQVGWLNVETTYFAIGVSSLAACAWWAYRWRDRWTVKADRLAPDWREMWNFSRWLLAARALGESSRVVMPWIVAAFLGAAGAGVLATCITLVGLSWIFVRGLNHYFRPTTVYAFIHGGPDAVRRSVLHTALVYASILGGLCLFYAVAGDWLFELVYGHRPAGVWLVVLLQGFVTLAVSMGTAAGNGLVAIDRPRANLWIEGVIAVVTLVAAIVLIPTSGLAGASAAMLAGFAAGAVVAFALLERELKQLEPSPVAPTHRADVNPIG